MLLEPRDWSVADGVDALLARLPPAIGSHASAATHARVLELRTGAHATVADAAAELDELRGGVDRTLRERLGLRVASAGTHPLATRSDVGNAAGLRYRQIEASMRIIGPARADDGPARARGGTRPGGGGPRPRRSAC